jgi:outer membrane protein assembly factor BamB
LTLLTAAASGADTAERKAENELARQILDATGLTGGLIVHLDCGDGRLTAALRANDHYVVQGLNTDAGEVEQARKYIQGLGIYGPVSVERFGGKRLPYAENLVNLVVAENLGGVTMAEAIRVTAPGGTVYAKRDGRWAKTVKPRPDNIDEWTHYLHDAGGNPVAHDEVVGPPARIQWTAEPRHTRSHEHVPGIQALVSAGGRIFYIANEAAIASIRERARWQLTARDAFNGTLLWKQPIGTWFPEIVNWGQTPPQLQRKLVASADRVYVTLGLHAPLSAADAATGEVVKVYDDTRGTEEIVLCEGILLLVVRSVTDERIAELAKWAELAGRRESPLDDRDSAEPLVKRLRATEAKGEKAVLAVDARSGRLLWKTAGASVSGLKTNTLCADGRRVFYQNGNGAVCLDLESGKELWSKASGPLRLVQDGRVICADGKAVTALEAETGQTLWTQPASLVEIRDAFVAAGSLWLGGFQPIENKRGPVWGPYFVTQRDLATGEKLRYIEPENPGHHHRCYSNKATDRYILGGRRGTEFIDLDSGEVLWNSWARGVCKYGVMPANGLLYTPPHACGCYVEAKLTGFNALAPRSMEESGQPDSEETPRLERGSAYDAPLSAVGSPLSTDWPTYRGDAQRSGGTQSPVPAVLDRKWQVDLGGRITSPSVAGGKVFVARVDQHAVSALAADSGQIVWRFTGGARVDSPPSLYRDRAIFGCADGYVYSVRASDGALAWRWRAAREERRIEVRGQLESVSPVHGSVLIQDDVVHLTAGRSSYTDGGIDLCRIDPGTGETLSRTSIYSPDPETGRQPAHLAPAIMPGSRSDILSADGSHLYLQDAVFDKQGVRQSTPSPHLFALTGFLDDSWPHRSYWIFGAECSLATGCSGRDKNLLYGRLLAFDDTRIFGYGRKSVHWSNQLQDGPYRLFAVNRAEGTEAWTKPPAVQVRAMLLADKLLFVAGPPAEAVDRPDGRDESQPALLVALSAADGSELARYQLDDSPVFDGMAAAAGRLYIALENGRLVCMGN